MNRRTFLCGLTLGTVATPLTTDAQQAGRVYRIGYLSSLSSAVGRRFLTAFRQGLRDFGWVEGRNIVIESRWAEGNLERLTGLAKELVGLNPDLIMSTGGSPTVRAAMAATKTVPIVMVEVGDPVATGFVTNLARPEGNVTGLTNMARDLTQKRLALLKEALPSATRIAVIMDPGDPIVPAQWREAQLAADRLGLQLQRLEVRNADDLRKAFRAAVDGKAEAVLRLADPLALVLGAETAELALKHRLPLMVRARPEVEMGGLMSYYADALDYYRRAAYYVDRILRGTKPGDLPIEQPTKFELVINLKTARALGLTITQSLLLRADQVIE